jgi:hypothetical protein
MKAKGIKVRPLKHGKIVRTRLGLLINGDRWDGRHELILPPNTPDEIVREVQQQQERSKVRRRARNAAHRRRLGR